MVTRNGFTIYIIMFRDRFTPRVLAAMLDEVNGKFGARCESMLTLQVCHSREYTRFTSLAQE